MNRAILLGFLISVAALASPGIPAPRCIDTKSVCCNGHGCSFLTTITVKNLAMSPGIPAPKDPPKTCDSSGGNGNGCD